MEKIANHTALKEWASVIEALGRGEQIILIRKGGIADPKFGVESERFYLYPTYYHEPVAASEPKEVTITHWCEVARTWEVRDVNALEALVPFVVMPREALETRYRFRADQALHVIAVRAFALPAPATIPVKSDYVGCRSWISVDDEVAIDGSRPALDESTLASKIGAIDKALAAAAVR